MADELLSGLQHTMNIQPHAFHLGYGQSIEEAFNLPLATQGKLTHLSIAHTDDFPRFLSFLSLCPNLISLEYGPGEEGISGSIPPTTTPLLKQFRGPLALAKILIPGRPLEEIVVISSSVTGSPPWRLEELAPVGLGRGVVKRLELADFVWEDGCIFRIAKEFSAVEALILHPIGNTRVSHCMGTTFVD